MCTYNNMIQLYFIKGNFFDSDILFKNLWNSTDFVLSLDELSYYTFINYLLTCYSNNL